MIKITMLVHVVDVAGYTIGTKLVKGLCCSPRPSISLGSQPAARRGGRRRKPRSCRLLLAVLTAAGAPARLPGKALVPALAALPLADANGHTP